MIMVGKVFIALIWTLWLFASGSVADGAEIKPHDYSKMSIEERRAIQKKWEVEDIGVQHGVCPILKDSEQDSILPSLIPP